MMASDRTRTLGRLLSRLRSHHDAAIAQTACPDCCACHGDPVLREFVRSFLAWDASLVKADNALKRIDQAVVDINEFRVCMPDEMCQIVGPNYPRVEERCQRLRSALNDVYKREHRVSLAQLADKSKRAAREYLDGLAGIVPYVSARTVLVALGGHAFPLDSRSHQKLVQADVLDEGMTPEDASAWMERSVRAGEALAAYGLIQAWCDSADKPAARRAKAGPRKASEPRRRPRSA